MASPKRTRLAILPDEGVARRLRDIQALLERTGTVMLTCASSTLGTHLALKAILDAGFAHRRRPAGASADERESVTSRARGLASGSCTLRLWHAASRRHVLPSSARHCRARRDTRRGRQGGRCKVSSSSTATAPCAKPSSRRRDGGRTPGRSYTMLRAALRDGRRHVETGVARGQGAGRRRDGAPLPRLNIVEQTIVRHLVARAQQAARLRERMRTWVTRVLGMLREAVLEADRRLSAAISSKPTARARGGGDDVAKVRALLSHDRRGRQRAAHVPRRPRSARPLAPSRVRARQGATQSACDVRGRAAARRVAAVRGGGAARPRRERRGRRRQRARLFREGEMGELAARRDARRPHDRRRVDAAFPDCCRRRHRARRPAIARRCRRARVRSPERRRTSRGSRALFARAIASGSTAIGGSSRSSRQGRWPLAIRWVANPETAAPSARSSRAPVPMRARSPKGASFLGASASDATTKWSRGGRGRRRSRDHATPRRALDHRARSRPRCRGQTSPGMPTIADQTGASHALVAARCAYPRPPRAARSRDLPSSTETSAASSSSRSPETAAARLGAGRAQNGAATSGVTSPSLARARAARTARGTPQSAARAIHSKRAAFGRGSDVRSDSLCHRKPASGQRRSSPPELFSH